MISKEQKDCPWKGSVLNQGDACPKHAAPSKAKDEDMSSLLVPSYL